jgi:hypothetical protein
VFFLSPLLVACANPNYSTTRPAIMTEPIDHASPDYWYKQPSVASVTSSDFDGLWKASADTIIFDQFEIDDHDDRLGILTTRPMISKQFFEPWRSDAGDAHEVIQNSLQTIRRTVRFDFARNAQGQFIAYPKVLMEQLSHPERRITAQAQFGQAFAATYEEPNRINDEGVKIANRYWYSIGRDTEMEKELANAVRQRLHEKSETRNPNPESNPKPE